MRRALLVGSCALALAVATLVTGVALWLALLNPTTHRDEIAAWLSKGLGRQVTVHGGVHLAVFPWLGLHLGQLAVADADGVSRFADARAAVVQVRLWPLLTQGDVELDRIVLMEPVLHLKRDARGACNWEDLLTLGDVASVPEEQGFSPGTLRWRGVSIVNGLLLFDDALRGQQVRLSGVHCITGEGTSFDIALQCHAESSRFGAGSLEVQGHCRVDVTDGNVLLDNATLAFQGSILPDGVSGPAAVPLTLRTGLLLDTAASRLEFRQARLGIAGEQVAADVQFEGLSAPALRIAGVVSREAVAGGASSVLWETVAARAAFEWQPERLTLRDIALSTRHSALAGNATLTLGASPALATQLDVSRLNVDELIAVGGGGAFAMDQVDQALASLANGTLPGAPAPFDGLRVQAGVRIAELTMGGRRLQRTSAEASLDRAGLALRLAMEEGCGGPVSGEGTLTPKGLALSLQAGSLQLARCPELKGVLGNALVHAGGVTLGVNATASGTSPEAWADTWDVAAAVAVTNGASDWDRIRQWFDAAPSTTQTVGQQAGTFTALHLQLKAAAGTRSRSAVTRTAQAEASVTLKGLRMEAAAPVDAAIRVSGTATLDPRTWALQTLSGVQLDTAAALPAGLAGKTATSATLKARGEWDLLKNRLQLASFQLKAHGSQATGSLSARLGETPVIQGQTSIAPVTLASLWPVLGIAPPNPKDPTAFTRAELATEWKLEGSRLSLSNLKTRLDDTTVGGDLSFVLGANGPTAWRFHLQADQLNLNRYFSASASATAKPWDGKFLQSLQGKGSLYCKTFELYDIVFSDVAMNLEGLPGQLRMEPFTATLAGGRMQATLALLADKKRPGLELQVGADISDFDLHTVADALGVGERLGGRTTLRFRLHSSGTSRAEHFQRLGGTASLQVANGFYGYYRTIKSDSTPTPTNEQLIKRPPASPAQGAKPAPPVRERAVINIVAAAGAMQFDQGMIRNNDFRMTSEQFTAIGAGWLDIPRETMEYVLQIYPGLFPSFPVYIRGPVEDPDVDDSQGGSLAAAVGELTGKVFRTVLDVLVLPLRTLENIKP